MFATLKTISTNQIIKHVRFDKSIQTIFNLSYAQWSLVVIPSIADFCTEHVFFRANIDTNLPSDKTLFCGYLVNVLKQCTSNIA